MQFGILGPLEVSDEGRRVEIGGHKQRALLASLLLHANEVVSLDRLIDELWGETPPPTAAKTLQAQVSRLRRSLNGDEDPAAHMRGPLQTRGHGYVLTVEPGQVDADRFQGMLEEARRARAEGKPEDAAEELRRALALWRGPALADFAYESFAQTEIARLDELQLTALEERIEADLALGRHAELVGELEALVARHPLRERLRGQLMLALYRSDRQAEALHAYQEFRLALAEELGLEPSQGLQRLERQILEQDPELAAPARRPGPRPARRRARLLVLAGALLLAAAVGAVVVLLVRDGGGAVAGSEETIAGGNAGVLDPRTGELLATIPLGTAPTSIAVGEGSVWVLDADDRTVSQIDPKERAVVRTFSTGSTPTDLAVGAGAIWIGNGVRQGRTALPESVSRFGPESAVVDETIPLSRASGATLVWVSAGQPETAHRGDGCRCLGGQSRSERLPDRPADEPGRGGRCRRPGVQHRCGRGRGVDPQRPRGGRRDRSSDERRLEGDPGRRREPDRARRRRRRGLGRRSRRRQRLADRPRPGAHPAHHLARGRRRRGRLRRGGGLGDQRDRRRGLPHRPGHERSSGRQPDGGTARSRRRRGRRLGDVGGAAVGRGGSPGFLLRQARLRRSGQPAFRRRVRSRRCRASSERSPCP